MRVVTLALALLLSLVATAADSGRWIKISGGAWEPQGTDFPALEKAFRLAVTAASQNHGRIPEWQSYTFQYQGRRTLLGRRYIYINAFCDDPKRHSLEQWVQVKDGGACFFNGKYNPESGEVFDLSVNGVG